jgi:hypothetical protein
MRVRGKCATNFEGLFKLRLCYLHSSRMFDQSNQNMDLLTLWHHSGGSYLKMKLHTTLCNSFYISAIASSAAPAIEVQFVCLRFLRINATFI